MTVYLIGAGMGNPDLLTGEALEAIQNSDLLLGASRLLEPFQELEMPKLPLVLPREILSALDSSRAERAAVLLSGDIGFFSGAKSLYPLLKHHKVVSIPGISSLSYFCARCHTTWQDAYILSCHGRDGGIVPAVQSHSKTFVLTGGEHYKVQELCRQLTEAGLGHLSAQAGEWLSYPQERIVSGTVAELAQEQFHDLAVILIENPVPIHPVFQTAGLPDEAFFRGKVPMTKEEVRTLCVSKLRLSSRDIVWDVGAGTGSVSVECALALPEGSVHAVERNPEGVELIEHNRQRFHLTNLFITEGNAPEVLEHLPVPTRVFIGGSGGKLKEIVAAALDKNPAARFVVTAITLETLTETLEVIRHYGFRETELVQVSVSKAHEVGRYHMMKAENPIYLISMEKPS